MSTREEHSKEKQVLKVMRKVLTSVVRDTTPEHKDLKHQLSDQTIDDIRNCLGLITAREQELNNMAGQPSLQRPYYLDGQSSTTVVPISSVAKGPEDDNPA